MVVTELAPLSAKAVFFYIQRHTEQAPLLPLIKINHL